ncbi:MAG: hypothetical protein QXJ86_01690 [Nitrososphaerales archaeon]
MHTTKSTPFTGLVLIILSIITLKLDAPLFAATSFLMVILGLILILLPDLKGVKMKPRQYSLREPSTSTTSANEWTDKCVICGKPVPPDVAYCDECSKKRG